MKKIRALNNPTPGLVEYLSCVGERVNWEEFRSHSSGASYKELRESLTQNQHRLCAYCEIGIRDCQVEHVIPQSDCELGKAQALDIANMVVCCLGGTAPEVGSEQGHRKRRGATCGQAKGNQRDERFVDPRQLPALPSLLRVIDNGLIQADEAACRMAGFPPDRVTRTIEILNLNSERLRSAREKRWNGLGEEWRQVDDPDDPEVLNEWMRAELRPDESGRLVPFFTTSRSYFAPLSESVLAEDPQDWI